MPELHGLTVRVTDRHGNNLPEWGIHHLKHTNRVSAYIQSTTNAAFQVSVRPNIPYVGPDLPQSNNKISDNCQHKRAGSEDVSPRTGHSRGHLPFNLSPSHCPEKAAVPPYSFVAALYLDGRTEPERKIVIYTDPDDDDFERPDGKAWFKYRWTQTSDGRIAEHGWIFKDRAIEWELNRLDLSAAVTRFKDQSNDENALADAMQSTGFGVHATAQDEKSKVGQILVEISRITVGAKYSEDNYLPALQEEKDDDFNMDDLGGEITHAAAFVRKSVIRPKPIRVVEISPYREGEGVYASFQFFYRSEEQLQKFAFPGFPTKPPISLKSWRQLHRQMADLTPLSLFPAGISKPKNPVYEAIETYEERVKNRSFKKGESPKHDFRLEYRDLLQGAPAPVATLLESNGHCTSAMKVNPTPWEGSGFAINENPGTYPKTTVYSAKDFPREHMPPCRYPDIDGESSDTSSFGPFLQSGANPLHSRSWFIAATEADRPCYSKFRDPSYFETTPGQLCEVYSSAEPMMAMSNSIDTAQPYYYPPSYYPPSTTFTTELPFRPNTHFHVSANSKPVKFSEDIADVVSAALPDHDSYPGLRSTANPDEDGAGHQGIRSPFSHLGLQKRRHAEIEGAEDAEADSSVGFTASENNGPASQSERLAPLGLIGDANHTRPGKKARVSGLGPSVDGSGTETQVAGEDAADPDGMAGIGSE